MTSIQCHIAPDGSLVASTRYADGQLLRVCGTPSNDPNPVLELEKTIELETRQYIEREIERILG
jgi:hypothetical protein